MEGAKKGPEVFYFNLIPHPSFFFKVWSVRSVPTMPPWTMSIPFGWDIFSFKPLPYRYTLSPVDKQRTNASILSLIKEFIGYHFLTLTLRKKRGRRNKKPPISKYHISKSPT
jgi:hypothetical protein